MAKKSALEQAIFENESLVKTVAENAKNMLFDSVKSQISQTLSESFDKEDEDKEDEVEVTDEVTDEVADEVENSEEDSEEDSEEVEDTENSEEDSEEGEPAVDAVDEPELDLDGEVEVVDEPAVDLPAIDNELSDEVEDVVDATGMSDDELIQVFKKVSDDTEIEVVKNDDESISIKKDGEEFVVKLNEEVDNKASFMESLESEEEEEVIYEINLDEEDVVQEELPVTADTVVNEEEPIEEVARTHSDGRNQTRKPNGFFKYASNRLRPALNESEEASKELLAEAENLKTEKAQLITEKEMLAEELGKHQDALRLMKENLETVALTNHKLLYVNKLFCEQATTLSEKQAIVERFDAEDINDQKSVKNLYKTISAEMKQAIKESVDVKLTESLGSTGESILEAHAKQQNTDPKLERMKYLMNVDAKR